MADNNPEFDYHDRQTVPLEDLSVDMIQDASRPIWTENLSKKAAGVSGILLDTLIQTGDEDAQEIRRVMEEGQIKQVADFSLDKVIQLAEHQLTLEDHIDNHPRLKRIIALSRATHAISVEAVGFDANAGTTGLGFLIKGANRAIDDLKYVGAIPLDTITVLQRAHAGIIRLADDEMSSNGDLSLEELAEQEESLLAVMDTEQSKTLAMHEENETSSVATTAYINGVHMTLSQLAHLNTKEVVDVAAMLKRSIKDGLAVEQGLEVGYVTRIDEAATHDYRVYLERSQAIARLADRFARARMAVNISELPIMRDKDNLAELFDAFDDAMNKAFNKLSHAEQNIFENFMDELKQRSKSQNQQYRPDN